MNGNKVGDWVDDSDDELNSDDVKLMRTENRILRNQLESVQRETTRLKKILQEYKKNEATSKKETEKKSADITAVKEKLQSLEEVNIRLSEEIERAKRNSDISIKSLSGEHSKQINTYEKLIEESSKEANKLISKYKSEEKNMNEMTKEINNLKNEIKVIQSNELQKIADIKKNYDEKIKKLQDERLEVNNESSVMIEMLKSQQSIRSEETRLKNIIDELTKKLIDSELQKEELNILRIKVAMYKEQLSDVPKMEKELDEFKQLNSDSFRTGSGLSLMEDADEILELRKKLEEANNKYEELASTQNNTEEEKLQNIELQNRIEDLSMEHEIELNKINSDYEMRIQKLIDEKTEIALEFEKEKEILVKYQLNSDSFRTGSGLSLMEDADEILELRKKLEEANNKYEELASTQNNTEEEKLQNRIEDLSMEHEIELNKVNSDYEMRIQKLIDEKTEIALEFEKEKEKLVKYQELKMNEEKESLNNVRMSKEEEEDKSVKAFLETIENLKKDIQILKDKLEDLNIENSQLLKEKFEYEKAEGSKKNIETEQVAKLQKTVDDIKQNHDKEIQVLRQEIDNERLQHEKEKNELLKNSQLKIEEMENALKKEYSDKSELIREDGNKVVDTKILNERDEEVKKLKEETRKFKEEINKLKEEKDRDRKVIEDLNLKYDEIKEKPAKEGKTEKIPTGMIDEEIEKLKTDHEAEIESLRQTMESQNYSSQMEINSLREEIAKNMSTFEVEKKVLLEDTKKKDLEIEKLEIRNTIEKTDEGEEHTKTKQPSTERFETAKEEESKAAEYERVIKDLKNKIIEMEISNKKAIESIMKLNKEQIADMENIASEMKNQHEQELANMYERIKLLEKVNKEMELNIRKENSNVGSNLEIENKKLQKQITKIKDHYHQLLESEIKLRKEVEAKLQEVDVIDSVMANRKSAKLPSGYRDEPIDRGDGFVNVQETLDKLAKHGMKCLSFNERVQLHEHTRDALADYIENNPLDLEYEPAVKPAEITIAPKERKQLLLKKIQEAEEKIKKNKLDSKNNVEDIKGKIKSTKNQVDTLCNRVKASSKKRFSAL